MKRRGIIPYDIRLTEKAQENRKKETPAEEKLWAILRNKQFGGYKFIRQKPIKCFILDFYCSKLLLGIEVDGSSHKDKKEYDDQRSSILDQIGIKVIRFYNSEIENNIEGVKSKLLKDINQRQSFINKTGHRILLAS